nr:hypothetical protein HUO10_005313 [Paraburkholderia busanensis]
MEEPKNDGQVFKATLYISRIGEVVDLRNSPDQADGPTNRSRDEAVVAILTWMLRHQLEEAVGAEVSPTEHFNDRLLDMI